MNYSLPFLGGRPLPCYYEFLSFFSARNRSTPLASRATPRISWNTTLYSLSLRILRSIKKAVKQRTVKATERIICISNILASCNPAYDKFNRIKNTHCAGDQNNQTHKSDKSTGGLWGGVQCFLGYIALPFERFVYTLERLVYSIKLSRYVRLFHFLL